MVERLKKLLAQLKKTEIRKNVIIVCVLLLLIGGSAVYIFTSPVVYKGETIYTYTESDMVIKRDEVKLVSTLAMPQTEADKIPLVIVCHGYTGNRNGFEPVPYARSFAANGIASLRLDFSSNGDSDGESTEMTITNMVEDVKAVYEMAKNIDGIDPEQIYLLGCSQGGLVCSIAAAQMQDEIAGLILNYPALTIPEDVRKGDFLGVTFDPEKLPDTLTAFKYTIGKCYLEDVMQYQIYDIIGAYTGPVYIAHGDKDDLIDSSCSEKADQIYENAEYYIVKGAGHGFSLGKLYDVEQREVDFVKQKAAEKQNL